MVTDRSTYVGLLAERRTPPEDQFPVRLRSRRWIARSENEGEIHRMRDLDEIITVIPWRWLLDERDLL